MTKSNGCGGGWMSHYWEWTKKGNTSNPGGQSVKTYADYNARNNNCRFQSETKISKAKEWGYASGVADMKNRLRQGPMSIAVEAGSKCFQWYDSGVLDMRTANEFGCSDRIDHGVVLVGIHYAGDEGNAADDNDNNDGDNNDGDGDNNDGDGDNNDGDGDGDDDTEYEEVCRRAKRSERRKK